MQEEYCTLNPVSRELTLTEPRLIAGVESDENVRCLKFKFPKIVEGTDFTQMQLRINFMNSRQEKGQYIVTDLKPVDGEADYITFTWQFSRLVTHYRGITKFVICAVKTDESGTITAEWNTALAQMRVLEGLEVDKPEISPEEKDVIAQLISICQDSADEAAQSAQQAQEEAEKVLDIIPVGGTKGQVLTKLSDEDKDYNWQDTAGLEGQNGATFTPSVSSEGVISWTNDKNLPNPEPVNIKGAQGPQGEKGLQGAAGEPGQPGTDGFSPTVKTESISGGTKVTITDKSGDKSFNVLNGKDGGQAATPEVGENGNWFINGADTGKPSRGEKGDKGEQGEPGATGEPGKDGANGITPTIGENGNWYLGDTDTGKPSRGEKGEPGGNQNVVDLGTIVFGNMEIFELSQEQGDAIFAKPNPSISVNMDEGKFIFSVIGSDENALFYTCNPIALAQAFMLIIIKAEDSYAGIASSAFCTKGDKEYKIVMAQGSPADSYPDGTIVGVY